MVTGGGYDEGVLRASCYLALLTLLLLVGCATPQIEPVLRIAPARRLVVLPFEEPATPRRWSSRRGGALARRTTALLAERAAFQVVPFDRLLTLAHETDVKRVPPGGAASQVGADVVLVCEVEHFDLEPQCISPCVARARVRLFEQGGRLVREDMVQAAYPGVPGQDWSLRPAAREAGLVDALARKVALLYVRHDEVRVEVE